jgi:hypothetical protein
MNKTEETRIERDSMGEMSVPANAYYGASTQRAVLKRSARDGQMPGLRLFPCWKSGWNGLRRTSPM